MGLMTVTSRQQYLRELGLYHGDIDGIAGPKTKKAYLDLQKKYFRREQDIDGIYGNDTDILLYDAYWVKKLCKHFELEEFRCDCGKCTGYPAKLNKQLLKDLETIRCHYNRPMTITSCLRCKHSNSSTQGSAKNSRHMDGRAADWYMAKVTDTLSNRKTTIVYLKKLPGFHYAYGNGCGSSGAVSAPYMGNALHFDVA